MDLYVEVKGEGAPIILIHSGGADLRDWSFVTPILAKEYQVIAFDGRGCGQSPSPTEPPNYVDDLLAILDHFQIEQAVIVGHSIGGQIATEFALSYPQRVNKLVLVAPGLSGFTHSKEYMEWTEKIGAEAPNIDRMMEVALSTCLYRVVMASPRRELMEQMWKHNISKTVEWATTEAIWPKPPAIERLGELSAPTCFIIGKKDAPDLHQIAECYRAVPDIRFVEMAEADHMPTLTHPEELCRHITEFLED